MGISESGLRLGMLDSIRQGAEGRLLAQIQLLSDAITARETAERLVGDRLRDVLSTQKLIAETTEQMHLLVHRSAA